MLVGATATVRGTPEARKHWDALLAELTHPVDAGFVRDAFEGDTVQPLPPEFLDALVHEGAKVPAFVWREAFEARWSAEENPHELELIAAPTPICWGDRHPHYPRSDQDALVEAIQGCAPDRVSGGRALSPLGAAGPVRIGRSRVRSGPRLIEPSTANVW